jgi:hypothetical protein
MTKLIWHSNYVVKIKFACNLMYMLLIGLVSRYVQALNTVAV